VRFSNKNDAKSATIGGEWLDVTRTSEMPNHGVTRRNSAAGTCGSCAVNVIVIRLHTVLRNSQRDIREEKIVERRDFLKLAFGVAAGAATLAASAQAAPLSLQPMEGQAPTPPANADAHPAVTSAEDAAQLTPEQVRWGHGHWHRHHWGRRRWHPHRRWRRW